MIKITSVVPQAEYSLQVGFSNGETKICDITLFLDKGAFTELKDKTIFNKVRSSGFSVEWPNELDLSADTLYSIGNNMPSR